MSFSRISEEVRERVRLQAGDRCGYCRSQQKYVLLRLGVSGLLLAGIPLKIKGKARAYAIALPQKPALVFAER